MAVGGNIGIIFNALKRSLAEEGFTESSSAWPTDMELRRGSGGLLVTSIKDCQTVLKVSLQQSSGNVDIRLEYRIDLPELYKEADDLVIENELLKLEHAIVEAAHAPKKRVLVVDDSGDILELIREILTMNNYEVDTAVNGAQALDKYAEFKPDIVTLDLSMPVMDGYETLLRIFKIDKDARVIVLTALESKELIERCLEKGAVAYMSKPFSEAQLLTTVTGALSREGEYDKDVAMLFSLVRDKIESVIRVTLAPEVSVVMKDVKLIRQEVPAQTFPAGVGYSRIVRVPKIIEPLEITIPAGTTCYVNEITGHQNGLILSLVRNEDLPILLGPSVFSSETHDPLEFFNVINLKVLSELANSSHLILNTEPVRLYDGAEDRKPPSKEVAQVEFEIVLGEKRIGLEVQLWFNMAKLFTHILGAR